MHSATGELPDQPAVNRAKGQLARFRLGARAGHMVKQPAQLGAREVGVDQQACLGLHQGLVAARPQIGADGLGPTVLPDDGMVNRLAGAPVPDHAGLTLIGNAQRMNLARCDAGLGQRCLGGSQLGLPDRDGVMLDPAGLRINLWQFLLRHTDYLAGGIKHNTAGAGGALV